MRMNPTVETPQELSTIESRVMRSLHRVGFTDLSVGHNGDGKIRISGKITDEKERAIIIAMATTVPSVTQVRFELE